MPKGALRGLLGGFASGVGQGLEKGGKMYAAKQIADSPNMTPLQKSIALLGVDEKYATAFLKQAQNQQALEGLQKEENRLLGNGPQGVGGPQMASRNVIMPDQQVNAIPPNVPQGFMNQAAFANQGAGIGQNMLPPQQEAPPQLQQRTPQEKLDAYRRLESQAANQNLHEKAAEYRSRAEEEASKIKEQNRINAKIQEEERARIRKFSEPFENLEELETNKNKLLEAEKLIKTGKVSFDTNILRNGFRALAEGTSLEEVGKIFQTPEQQRLWNLLRPSLQAKEIGGSNPSTREVLIAMSALPNEFQGQEANEFIIKNLINDADLKLEKGRSINKLDREKGLDFSTFRERLSQATAPVQERHQKSLASLGKVQEARQKLGGRKPAKGHIFALDPEGNIKEFPEKYRKAIEENDGVVIE